MTNTTLDKATRYLPNKIVIAIAISLGLASMPNLAATVTKELQPMSETTHLTATSESALSDRQAAFIPIAAFAAAGNRDRLHTAIIAGLDSGLSINEIKEVLIQVYAYAGFPRSLNALGQLMAITQARQEQGINDIEGNNPSHQIPSGDALLKAGTDNQTKLVGRPVAGPLFDFSPTIDTYLKTHLFGDIFERDNLDWQSRELATVSMLSALTGTDSQLQAHIGFSMNTGISAEQLYALVKVMSERVDSDSAERVNLAIKGHLDSLAP